METALAALSRAKRDTCVRACRRYIKELKKTSRANARAMPILVRMFRRYGRHDDDAAFHAGVALAVLYVRSPRPSACTAIMREVVGRFVDIMRVNGELALACAKTVLNIVRVDAELAPTDGELDELEDMYDSELFAGLIRAVAAERRKLRPHDDPSVVFYFPPDSDA